MIKWAAVLQIMASNSLWLCCAIITSRTRCLSVWTKHRMLVIPKSLLAFITCILFSVTLDGWLSTRTYAFFHLPASALGEVFALTFRPPLLALTVRVGTSLFSDWGTCTPLRDIPWHISNVEHQFYWKTFGESVVIKQHVSWSESQNIHCILIWNVMLLRILFAVGSSGLLDFFRMCAPSPTIFTYFSWIFVSW